MASEMISLDAARASAGPVILKLTDDVGFGATGAAWVYDARADHWHYLLVTPMIDSKGPDWVYERLLRVFSKIPLPDGITPLDIMIASPREAFFRQFPVHSVRRDAGNSHSIELRDTIINGVKIDYIAIYRMAPMKGNAGDQARMFDARVAALIAA